MEEMLIEQLRIAKKRIEQLQAERDRYKEALEEIGQVDPHHIEDGLALAQNIADQALEDKE